jgi:hypothetical protein
MLDYSIQNHPIQDRFDTTNQTLTYTRATLANRGSKTQNAKRPEEGDHGWHQVRRIALATAIQHYAACI